jgi:prepilin-type N-terminal cleavage/methylation domain-containing protein
VKKRLNGGQQGFTIVELLIASAIFSVMVLITSLVTIGLTKNYRKALVENSTQNTVRSIVDTVSQALQFSSAGAESLSGGSYCIGSTRYDYSPNLVLGKDTNKALTETRGTGNHCAGSGTGSQELLSTNMSLSKFDIAQDPSDPTVWTVSVQVAYGDLIGADNQFVKDISGTPIRCLSQNGSQFCAVRNLTTTVKSRL